MRVSDGKRLLGLIGVGFVVLAACRVNATVGGPDPCNYCYTDAEPFNWIDATTGGTQLAWTPGNCTNGTQAVALPFTFTFYGAGYTSVLASTNGDIQFTGNQTTRGAACLPDATFGASAWVLEENWSLCTAGSIWTKTTGVSPNQVVTIEWNGVPDSFFMGSSTFEVHLEQATNDLVYEYQSLFAQGTFSQGVGIQNATQSCFLVYGCGPLISANTAIRWGICPPTSTPTATATISNTATVSGTATYTATVTNTATRTFTPTATPTSTPSYTSTGTYTVTFTATGTPSPPVLVGPNPVSVGAGQYVTFYGLDFTIDTLRIYTVSGEFVASPVITGSGDPTLPQPWRNLYYSRLNPNATAVPWFGQETRWDLKNSKGIFVSPGVYYYAVERRTMENGRRVNLTYTGVLIVTK